MKRTIILLPFILLFGIVIFYFWGSSGSLSESQWNSNIVYHDNYKKSFDTVEVISFNLGYLSGMTNNLAVDRSKRLFDKNLKGASDLLIDLDVDIIGFQEIDFGSNRSYFQNQLDSLAKSSDFPVAYRSVNWDKNYVPFPYWPPSNHFGQLLSGQAILSKYELIPVETIVLEKPVNASFLYNAFYLDRLVQIARVKSGEQEIILMNVHLEAFDEETRANHGKLVKALFEKYAAEFPVLLIGDFNSEAVFLNASDAMSIIMTASNIESAITQELYDEEGTLTFPSDRPEKMIDYILYNSNRIEKVDARVVLEAREISDHFPIWMKFTLR